MGRKKVPASAPTQRRWRFRHLHKNISRARGVLATVSSFVRHLLPHTANRQKPTHTRAPPVCYSGSHLTSHLTENRKIYRVPNQVSPNKPESPFKSISKESADFFTKITRVSGNLHQILKSIPSINNFNFNNSPFHHTSPDISVTNFSCHFPFLFLSSYSSD